MIEWYVLPALAVAAIILAMIISDKADLISMDARQWGILTMLVIVWPAGVAFITAALLDWLTDE